MSLSCFSVLLSLQSGWFTVRVTAFRRSSLLGVCCLSQCDGIQRAIQSFASLCRLYTNLHMNISSKNTEAPLAPRCLSSPFRPVRSRVNSFYMETWQIVADGEKRHEFPQKSEKATKKIPLLLSFTLLSSVSSSLPFLLSSVSSLSPPLLLALYI